MTSQYLSGVGENKKFQCGFCLADGRHLVVAIEDYHPQNVDSDEIDNEDVEISNVVNFESHVAMQCRVCSKLSILEIKSLSYGDNVMPVSDEEIDSITQYPKINLFDSIDKAVLPDFTKEAILEIHKNMESKAYRSAITNIGAMIEHILGALISDYEGQNINKLQKCINDNKEVKNFTTAIKQAEEAGMFPDLIIQMLFICKNIRNISAHRRDATFTQLDVIKLMPISKYFLEYNYILPSLVNKSTYAKKNTNNT